MALDIHNPHWLQLAEEHRQWLGAFDPQYLSNWEKLLNADSEPALCEASVRRWLQSLGVAVEPNEKLTGKCGGPDYRCSVQKRHFYIETTCITIATATRKVGIADGPQPFTPISVWGMTEAVFAECVNKAPQCGGLDAPALVAVGTFHATAAMLGFKKVLVTGLLTGKTQMTWDIDTETGQQVGDTYETTALQAAAFLKPDKTQEVGFARSSISGVLLCGLGTEPGRCLGVLHPNPARPFDPTLLPGVEFGEVGIDRGSGQLRVRWPGGSDE
jgi:hypothetical protein